MLFFFTPGVFSQLLWITAASDDSDSSSDISAKIGLQKHSFETQKTEK